MERTNPAPRAIHGPTNPELPHDGVQRVGAAIILRPEMEDRYRELHAATWPAVLAQLHRSIVRNYSIYTAQLAGVTYLFSYFEYVGSDFAADMAAMAADPATREWWELTDPCQERIPGTPEGQQWLPLESVFHAPLDTPG